MTAPEIWLIDRKWLGFHTEARCSGMMSKQARVAVATAHNEPRRTSYYGLRGHQQAYNVADRLLMFLVLDFAEVVREFHQQALTLADWDLLTAEPLEKVGDGRLQRLRDYIHHSCRNAIVASFVPVNLLACHTDDFGELTPA
jgi:hypothetical protein